MAPTIGDPIPAGWSNNKFNVISIATDTALDVANDENGVQIHAWQYDENNDNQVWLFNLIDKNANVWTLQCPRNGHFLELENGDANDGAVLRASDRRGGNDPARHNQEWYIFLVEGSGGSARITLQNVMGGTVANVWAGDRSNGAKIAGYHWDASSPCIWKLVQQI